MGNAVFRCGTIIRQTDIIIHNKNVSDTCPATDWQADGFYDVISRLNDKEFPCLFARHAWKSKTLLFGFISHGYVPSELGFYNDKNSLEWKQYLLSEPDAFNPARCPLHINKEKLSQ